MDEFFRLKNEIEALIYHGHLARYVANQPNQAKSTEEKPTIEEPRNNQPTVGVINAICKGVSSTNNSELMPRQC